MGDKETTNNNRDYVYTDAERTMRAEYPLIVELVPSGASVIDLGCGNGLLMELLAQKGCDVQGYDLSESGVAAAKKRGLKAERRAIDQPFPELRDKQFDYAVCNVTIQMVMYPEVLLAEMGRIAHRQIVTFPNFAHFRSRLELLLGGRMPRPGLFGYEWYSTGHIHQFSVRDFEEFCHRLGFRVLRSQSVVPEAKGLKRSLIERFPNLFSVISLYELERAP